MADQAGWIASSAGTEDGQATKAAVAGDQYELRGIDASFDAAGVGQVELLDGATVIGTFDVHNQRSIPLYGLAITKGNAVTLREAAGVLTGVDVALNIHGVTR